MSSFSNLLGKYADLIQLIYYKQEITSAEASALLKKSIPYVTKQLAELNDAGFIKEKGVAVSSGGRRPVVYSPVNDALFFISVAINQHSSEIGIYDFSNKLVKECISVPAILAHDDLGVLDELVVKIREEIETSKTERDKIIGVAFGMPGFIDIGKGINHTFFSDDLNLRDYLSDKLDLPVLIDNDSSLIALAELKFGSHPKTDIMVVNIGWGIGLGMILNGEMFRGHSGMAGEFSHIPMFDDGLLCSCGKRDCLETKSSLTFIENKARALLAIGNVVTTLSSVSDVTIDEVFSNARRGDDFCIKLISGAAYNIGRGLATLIHIINPEYIILSGYGASVGNIWMAAVQQAINEHSILRIADKTHLLVSELGRTAALLGGTALLMENLPRLIHATITD